MEPRIIRRKKLATLEFALFLKEFSAGGSAYDNLSAVYNYLMK